MVGNSGNDQMRSGGAETFPFEIAVTCWLWGLAERGQKTPLRPHPDARWAQAAL